MAKILVAMSGGVDSAVSSYLLQLAGHEITGCYMKLFEDEKTHQENIRKVEKIANNLNFNYKVLDLKDDFNKFVYTPFVQTYQQGKTPNPCVLCNRFIKTGALVDFAKELKFDALATGHYIKIKNGLITEADDLSKDQSYFLANIKKETLNFIMFPLGEMKKEDVKKIASEIDFLKEFATQKESSEICFVKDSYVEILKEHIDVDKPGVVLNQNGEKIGTHQGYMHYTIGKRRGFEVFGAHEPHFVLNINPKENQITVGKKEELESSEFFVKDINMFINENSFECGVKVRYRSPKVPCFVEVENDRAKVVLKQPVFGIAAGQLAAFYKDNQVIGGGFIEN